MDVEEGKLEEELVVTDGVSLLSNFFGEDITDL